MLRRPLRALMCLLAILSVSACAQAPLGTGFDPLAFASTSGTHTVAKLRLPQGTEVNGVVRIHLVEGAFEDESAEQETFELRRTEAPFESRSGSLVLSFALKERDLRRYDRARSRLSNRLDTDAPASLRIDYRLCRKAGLPVNPPYIIGFLLTDDTSAPIYLAEIDLPREFLGGQLPFCV